MSMQDPDLTPEEARLSRLLRSADPTAVDSAATERRTQLFRARRQLVRDEPGEAARIDHLLDRVLIEARAAGSGQVGNPQAAAAGRAQRSVGGSPSDLAGTTHSVALLDPASEPARPARNVAPLEPTSEMVALVRPYAMTGGRTRTRYQLAIEALVSTTPRGRTGGFGLMPEHQRICDLCVEVKSLAEIAALMRMPLGVARVMVGDMAEAGLIAVHQSNTTEGKPDLALLERVLIGLRNL